MSCLRGIDVSEHQSAIDWDKVKGNIDFAMLRAGYGKGHVDKQFIRNATECNRLGIPIGIYWFSYAKTQAEAKAEAAFCIDTIKAFKIDWPVCYDFEYDSVNNAKLVGVTITKALATQMANAFLYDVEEAGYFAMNYSNIDYLGRYFDPALRSRFALWLACWPKAVKDPNTPPTTCGIWQWGGSTVPGISGSVDSNFAYVDYGARSATTPAAATTTPASTAPENEDWQLAAVKTALSDGLIGSDSWVNQYAQPATVGFVCQVATNLYNKIKGV